MTDDCFVGVIRDSPLVEVLLALKLVKTLQGAQRIYQMERRGLCRVTILHAAERRVEELKRDGN